MGKLANWQAGGGAAAAAAVDAVGVLNAYRYCLWPATTYRKAYASASATATATPLRPRRSRLTETHVGLWLHLVGVTQSI